MSKKFLSLAMTMLMTLFATNVWADWKYDCAAEDHVTGTTSHSRFTDKVGVIGSVSGEHEVATGQTSASPREVYCDCTETIWEIVPGEILTPTLNYSAEWMHKFVYVDWNADHRFVVNLTGDGPFEMGEGNELVAFGAINADDEDAPRYDSDGTARPASYTGIPTFKVPENIAPGDYTIRFKVDWSSPDPCGNQNTKNLIGNNGGMICDVTLRVVAPSVWNPNYIYTLQAAGSSVYATTRFHENQTVTASYIFSTDAEGFYIAGSEEDGWTLKSAESGKFIGISTAKNWNCDNNEDVWDIIAVEGEDDTYLIYRHGQNKGLGWDNAAADAGYFTDKTGKKWIIREKSAVNYTVSYNVKGLDEEAGDAFSVTSGGEAVADGAYFNKAKTIVVTATPGEGRMVTLTVNGNKVESPYTVEDCSFDLKIDAKFEGYRPATATKDVYPTLGLFGDDMMELFAKADADGRLFPTDEEFEAIGVSLADLAFVRSHVRPQEILDRATRLNDKTYEKRNLWMNVPIGIGKEKGGYPSSNFSDDAYTGWNYTNLFGSWNHGLLHSPGVAADCAHKNGTDIMAGIKFFESWTAGSQAAGWVGKCQQESENGYVSPTSGKKYKYVRPVVNALLYFGKDGINYNFEDNGFQNLADFHSCMYDYAAEIGFKNFHIGLYTAYSNLTDNNVASLLGSYDENRPGKGQAYDTFLNYSGGDFQTAGNIRTSVTAAEDSKFGTEDVYQGTWIVSMARSWKNLSAYPANKRMGIVLWGEHAQSRLLSYNTGTSSLDFQKNYQLLQDRFFSGGHRNPAARPDEINTSGWDLVNFQGLAEYVPERSAIHQNLPFTTYFSTGNGERYNYKGKKTLGTWYNLGQQDVVPTYRWLVYDAGTTTANTIDVPYFTHTDAYIGGSSLYLDNANAVDIVLYRAELKVSAANPMARIALKRVEGAPEGTVSVIVKKKGGNEWLETAFAQIEGNEWQSQEAALNGIAEGDVIEYVGIRTSGNTKGLMVGMLQLDDDVQVKPADIVESSVLAEVVEECQKSMSVKLRWNVAKTEGDRANWGMIYNDEANIDHFELLYKDGENGRVSEVGRTTSWSGYVGNIPMEEATKPYVGVRAVSIDGKTYTATTWVEIPRAKASDLPEALSASGNYPAIILDNSSDGLESALNNRWIRKFEVKNSDADFVYEDNVGTPYKHDILNGVKDKDADKTNYVFAEDYVIKVHQGQEVECTFDFQTESDALWYCTLNTYADWDCSEGFDGEGDEVVLLLGESNQKKKVEEMVPPFTFTLKVPEDAVPGTSRLRMVWSDAWFPHPGAAGAHNKGFAIDFPMEITGDNPGREAAADTHDTGIADEPVALEGGIDAIIGVAAPGASSFVVVDGELRFENTDKVWIYTPDGILVNYEKGGVNTVSTNNLKGVYLVRMQCGKVMRTRKIVL